MRDNPFSNRETVTINVDELDDAFIESISEVKEYALFEAELLYLYMNEKTGTFAEFELEGVSPSSTPQEAIAIFMQRVKTFGEEVATPLPQALLEVLTNAETDLFTLANYSEGYHKSIESMLYIQKRDSYYYDIYGFRYIVAGVGVQKAILWYEQQDGTLLKLHVKPEQLEEEGTKLQVQYVEGF